MPPPKNPYPYVAVGALEDSAYPLVVDFAARIE